ncbi:lysylphosphatidylglycerol synthetase-like protein (DUF2156 family) [Leifsonia sp. AK011]|uniref:DUF4190 domain-containing protein n=1 Tax=Leifsonia sp. AK011 TaxID=2723075 RepID=UPI0015CAB2BA|nr:DUF4190 domain-containing protein [Leifsonia sp. AK011]NYF09184.1 lysylphosphatidylglycerol synthetase-like protein (DUF2156 family) [Leifsonia sp. AK011]
MSDVTPPASAPVPPAPAAPAASDGKTLGIVALVSVFFISLLGLILGFVARGQSKKAGVKNTPATVAIVLGFIFLALTILWIVIAVAGFSALVSQCAELGTGVHTLDNGVTVTCG